MNHLEVLARLVADLYQQVAALQAALEAKDAEMDELVQQAEGISPNRQAEQEAQAAEEPLTK